MLKIVIFLALCILPSVVAASSAHEWEAFLSAPKQTTYEAMVTLIQKCKNQSCYDGISPDSKSVDKLIRLIETKNPYGIKIAFLALKLLHLDGGDLEDINRSLGLLVESNPKLFLDLVNTYGLSDYQLERLLTMLPEKTIDDKSAKISTVDRRVKSISEVKSPRLLDLRDKSLKILRRFKSKIREATKGRPNIQQKRV